MSENNPFKKSKEKMKTSDIGEGFQFGVDEAVLGSRKRTKLLVFKENALEAFKEAEFYFGLGAPEGGEDSSVSQRASGIARELTDQSNGEFKIKTVRTDKFPSGWALVKFPVDNCEEEDEEEETE